MIEYENPGVWTKRGCPDPKCPLFLPLPTQREEDMINEKPKIISHNQLMKDLGNERGVKIVMGVGR